MTYSACDFSDSIWEALTQNGGIHKKEANDKHLDDNQSLQADYALTAITRFEEARDAAAAYLEQATRVLKGENSQSELENLAEADKRLKTALKAVKKPKVVE